MLNSYSNTFDPNPRFKSVRFPDGSQLTSASEAQDFHVKKKLRVDNNSLFDQDVDIEGDLIVKGNVTFVSTNIPDTSQQYVDQKFLDLYVLLGYDSSISKWKWSGLTNTDAADGTNLDARIMQSINLDDYYTKTQTDLRIQTSSTDALVYYNGTQNIFTGDDNTIYTNKRCSVIPVTNHFIIPASSNFNQFIIQNSDYGSGKVLTSDSQGVATWQDPGSITPTVQNIATANGQTSTASFTIKDVIPQTFRFIPNKAGVSTEVQQAGDILFGTTGGTLAITSGGVDASVIRPAGIRMNSNSTGFLELFGGWMFDGSNPTTWLKDVSNNYLGILMGNSIRLDSTGINLTHGGTSSAINLYGTINIKSKSVNNPAYNKNSDSITAALNVNGLITTSTLKVTNGTLTSGHVLTSDGAGNASWQPPTSSTTISSFTNDVTFDQSITVSDTTNTNLFNSDDGLIINNLITGNNYQVNANYYNGNTTGIDMVWSTSSSSFGVDTLANLGKLTTYYSKPNTIDYASIQVVANQESAIQIQVPIFVQHNWTFKNRTGTNGYDNEDKLNRFNFSFYRLSIVILNGTTEVARHDFTEHPDGSKRLGSIYYEFDRSNSFIRSGTDPNYLISRDEDAVFIMQARAELDRITFHFLPPKSNVDITYTIRIIVQLKYIQSRGADLTNFIANGGHYPRVILQLGYQKQRVYTAIINGMLGAADVTLDPFVTFSSLNCMPFNANGNVQNDINYNLIDKRFTSIKFWSDDSILKSESGYLQGKTLAGGKYDVDNGYTFAFPSGLTSTTQLLPSLETAMNRSNYLTDLNKTNKISIAYINRLYVNQNIEAYGNLYCNGIGGKRGVSIVDGSTASIRKLVTTDTQPGNSLFNFYWAGGNIETWVDSTLVSVVAANFSDYRLKKNLERLPNDFLKRLCAIDLYSYSLVDMVRRYSNRYQEKIIKTGNIGFLAHEIQEKFHEFPNLVYGLKDDDQFQQVDYQQVLVVNMKAIQELNEKVELLSNRVYRNDALNATLLFLLFAFVFYLNY